ncbi:MAG: helix-turn-helix transcriptional regulator, partial [Bacilli bacterium]|nr:helix-turn-helix transcriptional regulator [Bacilli bacterium]
MNIEIANRLLELRKKNGYSQEELANKLGISRQSVSKWERAEASPDTDNLILLAKIYNVSLDELLGASSVDVEELRSNNEVVEENTQKFDKKVKKYSLIKKTISTIILSASVITYILLGSLLNLWHPYWVVFLFGIALDS